MAADLKPCPFCGGEAKVVLVKASFMLKRLHGRYVAAGCPDCGVSTKLFFANNKTGSPLINSAHEDNAKREAIKAWNRREGADD